MSRTLIIAEAGVNHNGDIGLAKELVDVAAEAEVDFVKFQSFRADSLASPDGELAEYQKKHDHANRSQRQMLRKLELSRDDHYTLVDYCNSKGVSFFSSAFDVGSLDLLLEFELEYFKIASGEITNLPFLQKIGKQQSRVILSTGMAEMIEIGNALAVLNAEGTPREKIIVLHCNTAYPTPMVDVNLRAMQSIAKEFEVPVGYSDHTLGIEVSIAAVALGAVCIEKHFTLDRSMLGPDHAASLEPAELIQMVQSIRNVEDALGGAAKILTPSETANRAVARKSIHIVGDLEGGHVLTAKDLVMKRPGNGISPMDLERVIGRKIKRALKKDVMLSLKDIS